MGSRESDYEREARERTHTDFDPLDPCLSCDGTDGEHTPECYFAPWPTVRAEDGHD